MSNIKSSNENGVKLEGFISVELYNKKDKVRRVYKNTITNAGKQFFLDKCAGRILSIGADTFGSMGAVGIIDKIGDNRSSMSFGGRISRSDSVLTNVLLNLGTDADSLTVNSTYINIFDNNLSEATKLVGYANNNIVPVKDGKEGSIDYSKGEYVIDPYTVCERWKYPEGVATGRIDTIAMMPAKCVKSNQGNGVAISKCIDKVNTQYTNFVSQSNGFLIPGVSGYTANDEILLNYNQDNGSQWKFNMTTGDITEVVVGDPFFVLDSSILDVMIEGNYLYTLKENGETPSLSGRNLQVYVYDINNSMNQVGYFNLPDEMSGAMRRIGGKFLRVGSSVYVTAWSDLDTISDGHSRLFTLRKLDTDYYNNGNVSATDYSSIGFTVPSGLNIKVVGLGNYGDNYVMFVATPTPGYNASADCTSYGIVFTSLNDPIGTMIDKISGLTPNSILFSAGSNKGYLRVGLNKYGGYSNSFGDGGDVTDGLKKIYNTSNEDGKEVSTVTHGVYLCLDGWWTDVISFVKLQTPIDKGDEDIMYVSYGYKVV